MTRRIHSRYVPSQSMNDCALSLMDLLEYNVSERTLQESIRAQLALKDPEPNCEHSCDDDGQAHTIRQNFR